MDRSELRSLQVGMFFCGVLSSTFYGAYLALASVTIYRLHGMAHLPKRMFWLLTSIAIANASFYTLLSISVGTLLRELLIPPLRWRSSWPIPAIFISTGAVFTIGDGLFIYRCWVIWAHPRWIWFPVLLLVSELATSMFSFFRSLASGTEAIAGVVGLWDAPLSVRATAVAAIVMTVSLNTLLATAAIARLMLARHALRSAALPGGGAHYVRISRVLSLSAVVYGTAWLPILFCHPAGHAAPYYVVLFAVVASMPLAVMLNAGGEIQEHSFVLPVIEDGGHAIESKI